MWNRQRTETFRVLTARLATGAGAIHWHVPSKDDLLAAAADDVIAGGDAAAGHDDCEQFLAGIDLILAGIDLILAGITTVR